MHTFYYNVLYGAWLLEPDWTVYWNLSQDSELP